MSRKHWIDLFIGLVITVAILAGIEVGLASAGLGEIPTENNWSRGFDPEARYLVPVEGQPGSWETRFKHKTRPEVTIAPKGKLKRILTFGGSNTAGFDTDYMEDVLAEQVGDGNYEAFNLGRPGYGSERVKFIFLQAIEVLEPDLVVIYSGHNEFVERGFQIDLEQASSGAWTEPAKDVARQTRLFNSIVDYYAEEEVKREKEPEDWENEYSKFADITYDETLEYFSAFEENLRVMCEAALEKDIDVVLCTIVHNRLSVPFSSTFPKDFDAKKIQQFKKLRKGALNRLPEYFTYLLPLKEKDRLHGLEYAVKPRVKESTEQDAGIDRSLYTGWRDARGFLEDRDPVMPHPSRWARKVFAFFDALLKLQERDFAEKDRDAIVRAEKSLKEAIDIYPDHPRALFEYALVKQLLNRKGGVVEALLERAADLDRAPRKGSNMVNNLIRGVAEDIDGVVLADIDDAFTKCLPNGLVSWEWMADHCHLNKGGREAIVEQMVRAILEARRNSAPSAGSNNE